MCASSTSTPLQIDQIIVPIFNYITTRDATLAVTSVRLCSRVRMANAVGKGKWVACS